MSTHLTADFFTKNRRNLIKKSGAAAVVIPANGLLQKTADTTFPFVQDSNFWYLTGCNLPDAVLVITPKEGWLIVPGRSEVRAAFDGAIDVTAIATRSGISLVYDERIGWERLKNVLEAGQRLGFLAPSTLYDAAHGMYANPARRRVADKLKRTFPDQDLVDVRPVLRDLRVIKQPEEIACIEQAVEITKHAIEAMCTSAAFKKMTREYEIEATLEYGFRRSGGDGHAFTPIVAAGANATTLHYVDNQGSVEPEDYIVVDVGTQIEHYAADISRTICQGKPTARQRKVYEAVERTQQRALALLKPGVVYRDYERKVTGYIGEELAGLGLITDKKDIAAIRRYYPHASSHFLGLDVHDTGDYAMKLAPGMVLTCEPGIYIPEEGIGVRIEDDVLITAHGNRVL